MEMIISAGALVGAGFSLGMKNSYEIKVIIFMKTLLASAISHLSLAAFCVDF